MLLQMIMGMVALASMQSLTTQQTQQRLVNVSFQLNIENFLTPTQYGLLSDVNIFYLDEQSNNVKTFDTLELNQEILNFSLIGYNYIELTEIAFTGATYDISYTARTEQQLEEGYYNIWNRHEGGNYFDLESIANLTPIREDMRMYTLQSKPDQTRITLNGWYTFDKKYQTEYAQTQAIYLYQDNTTNTNSTISWLTDTTTNSRYNTSEIGNGNVYILNDEICFPSSLITLRLPSEYNVHYLSNVQVNNTIFDDYNVYIINYPQELSPAIINTRIHFYNFNPKAIVNQVYNADYTQATLNEDLANTNILKTLFEGVAIFNNATIKTLKSNFRNNLDSTMQNEKFYVFPSSYEWYKTYGDYNGQNFTFAEPLTQPYTNNNQEWKKATGDIKLYTNEILLLFSDSYNVEHFQTNFYTSYTIESGTDGSLFSLITHGFRSLQVILDFKVGWLPVGQLMFAPLIVGFIVWLIHLVKRG